MKEITNEVFVPAVYIFENGTTIEFPGYTVSDQGRVKSKKRNKERILKQRESKSNNGAIYYQVTLYKDNRSYQLLVHRLILSSFDPKGFKPGDIVNHKVERTATSCINEFSNLEWITLKDNVNTEHCKELLSIAHTNHPAKSKRIRVTNLTTGESIVYPSAMEAGRALGMKSPRTVTSCICRRRGFYKKGNLHFSYI